MNTLTRRTIAGCLIAAATLAWPGPALADRPNPPPDRPQDGAPPQKQRPSAEGKEGRPRDESPSTPDQLRERIERRLEMVRGEESRLQRALERLAEGAPPEEVYEFLRQGPGPGKAWGSPRPGDDTLDAPGADVPEHFAPDMAPRVMRFLEEREPNMFRRLREARDRNPDRFNAMIQERWPKIREMIVKHARERGKQGENLDEIREFDRRTHDLAKQAAAAQGQDRTRLMGELRAALDAQFELHADNARREIAMLKDRIASLSERLEDTLTNRAQEIEDHMARLLEDKPPKPPDTDGQSPPEGAQDPDPPDR